MPMPLPPRSLSTLNHLYAVPSSHSRDFVRENKEYVRNKSKQQSKAKVLTIDHMPNYMNFKNSGGEHDKHLPNRNLSKNRSQTRPLNSEHNKKEPWTYGREAADRATQNASKTITSRPISSTKSTKANKKLQATTSSIAVQTEEINDEIYLYNALKKCASPAFKSALKAKYLQKEFGPKANQSPEPNEEIQLNLDDSHELQAKEALEQQRIHERQLAGHTKDLMNYGIYDVESIKSASTNGTQISKTRYFTPRDELDIKEKHIQKEQNGASLNFLTGLLNRCSPTKCANCPVGYHLLTDDEREQIRAKYLEHEALLIKQLNSFPLAIETLRVRQSKTRIEKELSIIEQNLRKLTKRKVYAKIHE